MQNINGLLTDVEMLEFMCSLPRGLSKDEFKVALAEYLRGRESSK